MSPRGSRLPNAADRGPICRASRNHAPEDRRAATRRHPPPPTVRRDGRMPVYALLDNIRSVWNVGSMFRTADAVGLGGLYLCGMTATPPRPGHGEDRPGRHPDRALGLLGRLPGRRPGTCRTRGLPLVVLEQTAGGRCLGRASTTPSPTASWWGTRSTACGRRFVELADQVVEIPMAGSQAIPERGGQLRRAGLRDPPALAGSGGGEVDT